MPKPVYIICANDVVQDKETNRISVFSIIERVRVSLLKDPPTPAQIGLHGSTPPHYQMKVMAVWMHESGDDGEFEHEFAVVCDSEVTELGSQPFVFDPNRPLNRFGLWFNGGVPLPKETTVFLVRSRVRRSGTEAWYCQEYPVGVEIVDLQSPPRDPDQVEADGPE